MKRILLLLFAAFIFSLPFFYAEEEKQAPPEDNSLQSQTAGSERQAEVAATVNGREIFMSEVDYYAERAIELAKSRGREITPESRISARKAWINRLVTREVLFQVAEKKGIKVSYDELKEGLAKTNFNDDMPADKIKEYVKIDLAISKLIEEEILSKTTISNDEAERYYKENRTEFEEPDLVRASHIVALVEGSASEEKKGMARKTINTILDELREKGTDFKDIARQYTGGLIEVKEGDLGYFPRGKTAAAFEKTAFALKPGEMSDIVETNMGYHIMKVIDRKEARVIPLSEAMDKVKFYLKRKQTSPEVKEWVDRQKEEAQVVVIAE